MKPVTKERLASLRKRAWDVWVQIGTIFSNLFYAFICLMLIMVFIHLVWAKMDIEVLNMQLSRYDGKLTLVSFDLYSRAYMDVKDPEISCDMKGQSGTVIKTESRILYETLRKTEKKSFHFIEMGTIPDQVATITCHISDVSIKW